MAEKKLTLEDEIRGMLYMHGTTGSREPLPEDVGEAKVAQQQRFGVAFDKLDGLEDAVIRLARGIDAIHAKLGGADGQ